VVPPAQSDDVIAAEEVCIWPDEDGATNRVDDIIAAGTEEEDE